MMAVKCFLSLCLIVLQSGVNALEWPLNCQGNQAAGFHDAPLGERVEAPENDVGYQPAIFNPGVFDLHVNQVFMQNLANEDTSDIDLYLIQIAADGKESELMCRHVRAAANTAGFSCSNNPPSEMLLINELTGHYTRTSIGGWTFHSSTENIGGDSIFVEYGVCTPITTNNN